ncbi:winged helix-turn-helix domain-containing protein [candidate division WOR-3 bacterium]|nr:winged helix-turn-helix domain-containing protein [candidate division WOR-3 bacterium]
MGKEILIKDGVKYILKRPEPEPTKFEPMIKNYVKDIFGPACIYFAKRGMESLAGNRSIPDGFVVDFKNKEWYIVELKLLGDDAIRRIAGQIVNYKNAVRNPKTQKEIRTAIRKEIGNLDYKEKAEVNYYCKDIPTFLELIYDEPPEIVVIIDNMTGEDGKRMEESIHGADENAKIVEFKTFVRKGTENVYVHLFEPLFESVVKKGIPENLKEKGKKEKMTSQKEYLIPILEALIKMGGSGKVKDIKEQVKNKMRDRLTPADCEKLPSGPIRWSSAIGWERFAMIGKGLLKKNSPEGIWEITDKGRNYYSNKK